MSGTHLRQTIRLDTIDRLTGIPGVGGGPFTSMQEVVAEAELPTVVVWIASEPSQYIGGMSSMGRVQTRKIALAVIALASTMDVLEGLALEVERRLVTEPVSREYLYRGTEFGDSREGRFQYLSAQLNYELVYETGERDPTQDIDL